MFNESTLRSHFAKNAPIVVAAAALALPFMIGSKNPPALYAQAAEPTPKFEVSSIRPCTLKAGSENKRGNSSPGRLSTGCDVLVDNNDLGFIHFAYVQFEGGRLHSYDMTPILGGPKWIRSEGYQIEAVSEAHPSLAVMYGPMLQELLQKRFKLKIHRETRDRPVYALTLIKGGSKLKPFVEGSCLQGPFPQGPPPRGQKLCDRNISALNPASVDADGLTLPEFSQMLNQVLDRPVVDNTGIMGKYSFHLKFSRDDSTSRLPPLPVAPRGGPPTGTADVTSPSIFAAMQDQLGLKLVAIKKPIEVLVIDSAQKPSEN